MRKTRSSLTSKGTWTVPFFGGRDTSMKGVAHEEKIYIQIR